MPSPPIWFPCTFLLVAGLFSAGPADAKFVVYHFGTQTWPAGPLPAEVESSGPEGFEAGYQCEAFGIFSADIFVWDCRPCLVNEKGEQYMPLDDAPKVSAAIVAAYTFNEVKRGPWEKHGRWLFLFLGLLAIYGWATERGEPEKHADDDEMS